MSAYRLRMTEIERVGESEAKPKSSPSRLKEESKGDRIRRQLRQLRRLLRSLVHRRREDEGNTPKRLAEGKKASKSWTSGLNNSSTNIQREGSAFSVPVEPESCGDWAFIDD